MIQSQLASRRQLAIEGISAELERITGTRIDLVGGMKGDNQHKQLFMLERIHEAMKGYLFETLQLEESEGNPSYTLAEILEVHGLSKTSQKALQAALDGSSN